MKSNSRTRLSVSVVASLALSLTSQFALTDGVNPHHVYLLNGKAVTGWTVSVGDPDNWFTPLEKDSVTSAGKKIKVEPTVFNDQLPALSINWNGRQKTTGTFGIAGSAIDLSNFKDSAALVLDIRIDRKPDKEVYIGMSCGYPCEGRINARRLLGQSPQKQWFSLPIPLNCLKGDDFDLSKITTPLQIATEGRLELAVLNVRLEKLEAGETGCTN